jgi:hypothetical protein
VRHPGYRAEKSGGHVVTTPFSGLPHKENFQTYNRLQRHSRTSHQPFLPGIRSPETSEPPSLQGSSTFNPFPSHHPGSYTELELLCEKGGSLARLLLEQPFSVLSPGSQFRPVTALAKLLGGHLLWPRWNNVLSHGASYPLEDYSNGEMALDLSEQLAQGNHKSVQQ